MNVSELRELLSVDVVLLKWPLGSKGTPRKWGHFTVADMTPVYLKKLESGNIGVALGAKSGDLVALDVDDDNLIEPFLTANPFLNGTLQTHGARGRVFWLRMAGAYPTKTVKLKTHSGDDCGEFRSNGSQSIIYGIHPNGNPYEIVNHAKPMQVDFARIVWPDEIRNPPSETKQFQEPNWTEVTEVAEVADAADETGEAKVILPPGLLFFSLINSVDDAVNKCLPTKTHENNLRLFDLARAMLTLQQQAIRFVADEVFEIWHSRAKSFLRPELTKEDYYLEFLKACHRAKIPLVSSKVAAAWERAKQNLLPLPKKVMSIQKPDFRLLCAFFREMQAGEGPGKEWFVAGGQRACARLLGHKSHSTVETWIGALHTMKVLVTIKTGDAHHSTRFQYVGELDE